MMASSEVVVREHVPADRSGVRALLQSVFGDSSGYDKFETANPAGEPVRVVAVLRDEIVGFNLWNAWRVPDPQCPTFFQSGASAVSAKARGKGVFARLLAEGENIARGRGIEWFLGFPNPASLRSFLSAGWTHITSMPLFLVLRPGLGKSEEDGSTPVSLDGDAFRKWRYEHANATCRLVRLRSGKEAFVYFRLQPRWGVSLVKVLDVLVEGKRDLSTITEISASIPGVIMFRTSESFVHARLTALRVPRSWATPVIVKALSESSESTARAVQGAVYALGDIDAG